MRLPLLAALSAGLSLTQCQFSSLGLGEGGGPGSTTEQSSGEASTTAPSTGDPTTGDPTTGDDNCGNALPDEGEACDNGAANNGKNGSICKADCQLNTCGDGYEASNEGCDDGNTVAGDGCSPDCKLEGCGDGVLEPPEQCDDGNVIDGDGCSSLCKLPFCGDNIQDPLEECDNGVAANLDKNACTSDCTKNVCGDGKVHEGVEACDDGNKVNDDECTNACVLATCGDGEMQPGEQCDDGNLVNEDACTNLCQLPSCGDGYIQESNKEQCDDGRNNGNDKPCTLTCQTNICGDGHTLMGEEECDDGNLVETDACLNNCKMAKCGDGKVQAGVEVCDDGVNDGKYNGCAADCKSLGPRCGDKIINGPEDCDDGNMLTTDTCDNSCKRLRFHVFVTSTKYKADFDGIEKADEACNARATAAMLPGAGNFKAWLSTIIPEETPVTRLFKSTQPYILINNDKVADDWADLVDNSLDLAITRTEANMPATGGNPANCEANGAAGTLVWTSTAPNGASNGAHCESWTLLAGGMGGVGMLNHTDTKWTEACAVTCDMEARFYCFEQPKPKP